MSEHESLTVLFLCTGNSARSIIAEYLLRRAGSPRFEVFSAGAHPKGEVHPLALEVLKEDYEIDALDARSKSWEEFRNVPLDFVITVCDNAKESCPIFPGHPATAHWGMPDPAAVEGTPEERYAAFQEAAHVLQGRIERFRAEHLAFP
ncbi:MAG: arsenate reductase ArsC [Thermoanaerobaculia bacterium]